MEATQNEFPGGAKFDSKVLEKGTRERVAGRSDFRLQTSNFQSAPLQPRMDPVGHRRPPLRIALDERLDLLGRQVKSLVTQVGERFAGAFDEALAQLFVRQQAADHQLNRFLRHEWVFGQCPRQAYRSGQRVKCAWFRFI